MQKSGEEVQFVVSRKSRPQTPDLIRSTGNEFPLKNASSDSDGCKLTPSRKIMERTVTIPKVSSFQQIAAVSFISVSSLTTKKADFEPLWDFFGLIFRTFLLFSQESSS